MSVARQSSIMKMESLVGLALGRQQLAVRTSELLEQRYLEGVPEQFPVLFGKRGATQSRERNHAVAQRRHRHAPLQAGQRELLQALGRSGQSLGPVSAQCLQGASIEDQSFRLQAEPWPENRDPRSRSPRAAKFL